MPIYGKGDQIRDWLFVEDHATALLKVITDGEASETYNIGGNNEKTNLEVVETICDILDKLSPCNIKGIKTYKELIKFVSDRPGHDKRYAIDASKIGSQLDFYPKETFESGVMKTVKWYLGNLNWSENILTNSYNGQRLGLIKGISKNYFSVKIS